ncbi:MAG: zinc ribbon domain-containing protein [Ignavibacteria bacterium]|jgi:putative FmdB family regulatory protein|nr:zinc ribbon domain-containing protein [Ignavibacteria bacterium]MCU7503437.1 zinc ribbon domain-containing protein [Ignavibacteria bacterium]MCU7516231.1 zinc ribbon domain-containing protein [Ignavibacteria bacterium]
MPLFEYRCNACNTKFEVLHKSLSSQEEVICPKCKSGDSKKLLSSFSASVSGHHEHSAGGCENGSCCMSGVPGGCPSAGMCGMN